MSSSSRPSAHSSPSSLSAPPPLALPHGLNLYITRHGERVDQVFGIDWIEQAFRTYKIAGAEERAERERLEAQAARRKKREERKQAKLEMRRHTIDHARPELRHDDDAENGRSSSSSDDEPPQHVSFSFGGGGGNNSSSNSGIGAHSDLHHASYVRFNLNMPRDLPSRLPRRDISHFAEDAPLTECGHWQAGLVGEALLGANIQFVYASPALRCVQTAQAICLALGLVPPQQQQRRDGAAVAPGGMGTSGASSPAFSSTAAPIRATHARSQTLGGSVGLGGGGTSSSVNYALSAAPPSFSGIRIEYGLFEWTGWYRSYPHWLSPRELLHAGLHVDPSYQPVSLRPKQGESQREWYVRSSETMQRILARHFGSANAASANAGAGARASGAGGGSGATSRRGSGSSVDGLGSMPPLCLGSSPPGLGASGLSGTAGGGAAGPQPQLYTHGNILFVAHAGSLDTLSYGLLHSNLGAGSGSAVDAATAALRVAPSLEELSMGKRMRLFSNYCGTGRIQYVRHFNGGAASAAAAAASATGGSLEPATPAQSAAPAYSSGWSSRRASLALQCDTATGGAAAGSSSSASSSGASSPSVGASSSGQPSSSAVTAGHWQIADDSHYDMTNTSNDPFSFQLSYQSYQKTIAHLLTAVPAPAPTAGGPAHSPQSLAAIQQQLREAEEDGADAIVLRSASPGEGDEDVDADGETVPHPQSSPRLATSASAPAAVPVPAPVAPSYAPAVLALPAERMLDLSFRKLFGGLLDSCNSLANFLLALSAKQTEKLAGRVSREGEPTQQAPHRPVVHSPRRIGATGAGGPLSPSGRRSASIGSSSVAALLLQQQSAAGGALGGRLEQLAAAVAGSAVPASSASSSLSANASGVGSPTVLDSWILAEVHKNAPSMLQVLPREWAALLNYRGDALATHVYKLLIALRRFVVPLKRWQRLRKQEKNIVSWTCLLHHIARSDCLEPRGGGGGSNGGGAGCAHHPATVRCDFICSLSSCIAAVDILARQGFAKKDGAAASAGAGFLGSSFGNGSPRSPGSPTAAAFPPPSHSSRELGEWIRRAEKMRRELKEARDGRAAAGSATAASAAASVASVRAVPASAFNFDLAGSGGSSLFPPPPSSRPSTPPPSSLPPARHDGYPHSYDLLELVAGLEPIFGTDSTCSDILKGVLLHSLITGLVDDGGEGGGGGGSARQSGGGAGSAGGRELERARFQNLLLANSRSDATTSLTSSSSLPPGAAAAAAAAAGGSDAELLGLAGSDSPASASSAAPDASASAASVFAPRAAARHSGVPSSLLAIIPSCVSPRAFECIYLLSMAHVSASLLGDPRAAGRALIDLQEKVQDLKEMWAVQAEAKQAAAAAAAVAVAAIGGAGDGGQGALVRDPSAVDIAAAHGDRDADN